MSISGICVIIVVCLTSIILTLVVLEYKASCKESEKYRKLCKEMKLIEEIYDMDDAGLCESCKYGKNNCLRDGRAHCKNTEVNDET